MDQFPRVLMINGGPPHQGTATGLTLLSLFRGWPSDHLACLHASDVASAPGVCRHSLRLSWSNLGLLKEGFRLLGLELPTGGSLLAATARPAAAARGGGVGLQMEWRQLAKRAALGFARDVEAVQLFGYTTPPKMLGVLDDFRPQVIYTMLGSNGMLKLVSDMQRRFEIPIVPHIMDDWPETLYRNTLLRPVLRTMMRWRWRSVLAKSPVRMAISDSMAVEYERRYGGHFEAFMNVVEPECLVASPVPERPGELRFVYIGGLHLGRAEVLRGIGRALAAARGSSRQGILLIYTQDPSSPEGTSLRDAPGLRLLGSLAPQEVPAAMRDADVLVHVESFERDLRRYTRYSLSTKIPEYLAAGRPILAVGPPEVASIRYVEALGCGITVGSLDASQLKAGLEPLLDLPQRRRELGARGRLAAIEKHHAVLTRERFRRLLSEAAGQARKPTGP